MLIGGPDLRNLLNLQTTALGFVTREYNALRLTHVRYSRDLIAQFLVTLDQPENHEEIREKLHAALVDLSDEVARTEEHVA